MAMRPGDLCLNSAIIFCVTINVLAVTFNKILQIIHVLINFTFFSATCGDICEKFDI